MVGVNQIIDSKFQSSEEWTEQKRNKKHMTIKKKTHTTPNDTMSLFVNVKHSCAIQMDREEFQINAQERKHNTPHSVK